MKLLAGIELQNGADFVKVDKEMKMIDGVGFLWMKNETKGYIQPFYHNTCANNHTMFAREHLDCLYTKGVKFHQYCNAGQPRPARWVIGMESSSEYMRCIANLLLVLQLEKDGINSV